MHPVTVALTLAPAARMGILRCCYWSGFPDWHSTQCAMRVPGLRMRPKCLIQHYPEERLL